MDGSNQVTKTGVVQSVMKNGDSYTIKIDGVSFELSNITSIAQTDSSGSNDPGTKTSLGELIAKASMMIGMSATVNPSVEGGSVLDSGLIKSIQVKDGQVRVIINDKGNRHYLVAFDCEQNLAIHDLERRLRQGKLSFASEQRMERWLGLRPGSVSPFGLINDPERHVHLFLDRNLERFPAYSFHPNDNRATVVVSRSEFLRYLAAVGNTYEFIELY